MDVCQFIKAVLAQDENTIRNYFHKDAYVNWHCSNEHFTVEEFIIANCEYPGEWDGTVERVEVVGDLFITATKVYPQDRSAYFHVVSFIRTANDKIVSMDEYWADDGNPPKWRVDKHIGTSIQEFPICQTDKSALLYTVRCSALRAELGSPFGRAVGAAD